MKKKFDNARYITRGIQTELPLELQIFLWNCIDELQKEIELDYLQVFEFKKGIANNVPTQLIIHKQEVPEYSKEYIVRVNKIIETMVFVIDDNDHSTMQLSEEY